MNSPGVISKAATKRAVNRSAPLGVLVLGMHRSGTSALTRTLNLLGCALPEALVGASEGNELGHWESASAVILNDEILASAGSNWNDWGPINADWRASGVRGQMVERATEVIREHKALGPLFALKDPRLCRLADLWLDAADSAGVDMRVVLMLRHPGEVSASLESRDLMAPGYGQLLWLRHTLDAEHLSRGRKRVVCRFDRLLVDWQDTIDRVRQGLDLALPRNSPAAHAEVEQFLARDMRHHDAREDAGLGLLGAFDWLRRTFEIMQHWAGQGEEAADHAELDRIRAEFDNAYPAFSRLLPSSGYSGEFATGSRLRDQLQHQLAEVSERAQAIAQQAAEIDELRARGTELEGKIAALTAAYETVQARSEELQNEAAALREAAARAAELDGVVEALRQRESALAEEARSLAATRDEAEAALEALGAEVESLRAAATRVSGLEVEIARLVEREAELARWIDTQDTKIAAAVEASESERKLRTEIEQELATREAELAERIEEQDAELAAAVEASESERERRKEIEQELTTREAKLAQEKLGNAELTGRILAAESAAVQRQEELAQVWSQLEALQKSAGAAAAQIAAERERRTEAESRLAEVSEAATAAAAEAGIERDRRSEAEAQLAAAREAAIATAAETETQLAAVREAAVAAAAEAAVERDRRTGAEAQLAEAARNLSALAAGKGELEVRVRAAEAAALERQQEVAQLWNQLGTVQKATGAASAESAAERERRVDAEARLAAAMQDLRALGSEKGELEIRVRIAEMALASQRDEQLRSEAQLAEAKAATEAAATQGASERKFRLELEKSLAKAETAAAELRARLDDLEKAPSPDTVYAEIAQLTRMLEEHEMKAASAGAARVAAEQRITEQTQELARMTALLSQQSSRVEGIERHAEWLRDLTKISERMPKWWSLMPSSWRRKREHEAYRRAGIFNAEQYLELYPDVSMVGMDPVRHYILHGMAEGRTLFR
jgi:hypothetical protein